MFVAPSRPSLSSICQSDTTLIEVHHHHPFVFFFRLRRKNSSTINYCPFCGEGEGGERLTPSFLWPKEEGRGEISWPVSLSSSSSSLSPPWGCQLFWTLLLLLLLLSTIVGQQHVGSGFSREEEGGKKALLLVAGEVWGGRERGRKGEKGVEEKFFPWEIIQRSSRPVCIFLFSFFSLSQIRRRRKRG